MKKYLILVLILGCMAACSAYGAVLGSWALTSDGAGVSGDSTRVTVGNFTKGSGVGNITYGANGGYAASWPTANALDLTKYFEVTIAPRSGYALTITDIVFQERRSGTGPTAFQVRTSIDDFSTYTSVLEGTIPENTNERTRTIDGLSIAVADGKTLKVRLYGYGAGAAGGTWRIGDGSLKISGTAASAGPVYPSISFTPSSGLSVAVSNELPITVVLSPTGSAIQSSSISPTFAGTQTTSGNVITVKPVAADNGKNFTLSVIATNNVGARTGTVSFAVTPYVPPVPNITFSPSSLSVQATKTLAFTASVTPSGSFITGHTISPTPVGTLNRTGGSFNFQPASADGGKNFTVSVTATNEFGTRTNSINIVVSTYVPANTYILTFEGVSKTGYAPGDITFSGRTWNLDSVMIGKDAVDKKNGAQSARLQYRHSSAINLAITANEPFPDGLGTVSFMYGPYSAHTNTPILSIQVAEALAGPWYEVEQIETKTATWDKAEVKVELAGPLYFRIQGLYGGASSRSVNIDDITLPPFTGSSMTDYQKYLLSYNVTPGDLGTAENEDYDGDGYTNLQEYNASTNPFDLNSHP